MNIPFGCPKCLDTSTKKVENWYDKVAFNSAVTTGGSGSIDYDQNTLNSNCSKGIKGTADKSLPSGTFVPEWQQTYIPGNGVVTAKENMLYAGTKTDTQIYKLKKDVALGSFCGWVATNGGTTIAPSGSPPYVDEGYWSFACGLCVELTSKNRQTQYVAQVDNQDVCQMDNTKDWQFMDIHGSQTGLEGWYGPNGSNTDTSKLNIWSEDTQCGFGTGRLCKDLTWKIVPMTNCWETNSPTPPTPHPSPPPHHPPNAAHLPPNN